MSDFVRGIIWQDNMRGRDLFGFFRPIFAISRGLLMVVPRPICELGLTLLRYVPTKAGIALRYMLVSRLAASCGENVAVFEGVHLFRVDKMRIGNNVSVHQMCYLDASGGLTIGDDVAIAHATTIMTSDHKYSDVSMPIRDAEGTLAAVEIGDDVWVGAGVRILSGVKIGPHSVVAAGAVVTRDVDRNALVGGVPARLIKRIREATGEPITTV